MIAPPGSAWALQILFAGGVQILLDLLDFPVQLGSCPAQLVTGGVLELRPDLSVSHTQGHVGGAGAFGEHIAIVFQLLADDVDGFFVTVAGVIGLPDLRGEDLLGGEKTHKAHLFIFPGEDLLEKPFHFFRLCLPIGVRPGLVLLPLSLLFPLSLELQPGDMFKHGDRLAFVNCCGCGIF